LKEKWLIFATAVLQSHEVVSCNGSIITDIFPRWQTRFGST
jgi:hypothetical protein